MPDEAARPPVPPDVVAVLMAYAEGRTPERSLERTAVKATLAELVTRAPGRSVEVRIPPHAAVQVIEGVRHTRGTPAAVVEADARTWLELSTGRLTWNGAMTSGRLRASGERSDLSHLLPLFGSMTSV